MKKRIKMLEYTDLDDLGVAHDIIRQRKIDVALQLGKHSTDEALTFYCQPVGLAVGAGLGCQEGGQPAGILQPRHFRPRQRGRRLRDGHRALTERLKSWAMDAGVLMIPASQRRLREG
ncbi:hypothetical protein [Sphingobium sp. PNB]|jgi:hypothetical protein|uniref:hypothetical protein n=1 Tax=Sphingobium sp. PNB TaxID=863934 RepID=UPI0029BFDE64|nr:hypothetical protein [Sphingobium sp. PNB]